MRPIAIAAVDAFELWATTYWRSSGSTLGSLGYRPKGWKACSYCMSCVYFQGTGHITALEMAVIIKVPIKDYAHANGCLHEGSVSQGIILITAESLHNTCPVERQVTVRPPAWCVSMRSRSLFDSDTMDTSTAMRSKLIVFLKKRTTSSPVLLKLDIPSTCPKASIIHKNTT